MVAWPNDFAKIHKRIVKNTIDPKSFPTTTCVAKVIQFSGKLFICFQKNEFNLKTKKVAEDKGFLCVLVLKLYRNKKSRCLYIYATIG